MEIIVHTIKDLNRFLDLGLYVIMDSTTLALASLAKNPVLYVCPASDTLKFYQSLQDLKKLIVNWSNNRSLNREAVAAKYEHEIYMKYNFNIVEHYKLSKYGNI